MVDVGKLVQYWRQGSEEDWAAAWRLIDGGHFRHGLFLAHLAVEKVLKALVCRKIRDIAPRSHNLVRLAELAGIDVTARRKKILAGINEFNIEGRYPETLNPAPTAGEARAAMSQTQETLEWLTKQL